MTKYLSFTAILLSSVVWLGANTRIAVAQQNGGSSAKSANLDGTWNEIGDRLVFLMNRLINVEAELEACDAALGANGTATQSARNEKSDAQSTKGVPKNWREFYELVATQFYFHPAGRVTNYHTTSILDPSQLKDDGQRANPKATLPKLDSLEQVYKDAQADAKSSVQKLTRAEISARQHSLDKEEAELWHQIAMCAITDVDFATKPLYRFEPYSVAGAAKGVQQAQAAKAAALFMQAAIGAATDAERDLPHGSTAATQNLTEARERMITALLKYWPEESLNDAKAPLGRLQILSKRLVDAAGNLADSQKLVEREDLRANPRERDRIRTALQQSAVRYTQIVFALDETAVAMASDFQIRSDKFAPLTLPRVAGVANETSKSGLPAAKSVKADNGWDTFEGPEMKNAFEVGVRGLVSDAGIEFTAGALGLERSLATSRASYKLPVEAEFVVVANADACYDVCPGIGDFSLRWGENFNKNNYLYINKTTRFEATHPQIIPGEENVIKMRVDAAGHATISINGQEILNRETYVPTTGDVKVYLGGGIGHVEYRKVQVRSIPLDKQAVAAVPKPPAGNVPAVNAAPRKDNAWKEIAGDDLRKAFEMGARATGSSAGIELTAGELQEERSTATSKIAYKLPLEVEFTVVALPDSCLDVCPGFGDVELRWGDFWNKRTFLYVTKDVRFEAPHVKIVPGQENVIRMTADRNGQVTVSINGEQTFNRKADPNPDGEAKIVLGGGIGHVEYRKVRIRSE